LDSIKIPGNFIIWLKKENFPRNYLMAEKLAKAPLQEVIFDVRWALSPDESGNQLIDPNFNFALGKFHEDIKAEFPEVVSKFPGGVPHQMMNHQTMYQFWKDKNTWPVIQLGPGILTVNDTDQNYIWETKYLPLVEQMLQKVSRAYRDLKFTEFSLRYIDLVRIEDYDSENWQSFVQNSINFSFDNKFDTGGKLEQFQFNQTFDIKNIGKLHISLASGFDNTNKETFMWQITVSQKGSLDGSELTHWLKNAHECASRTFKDICKKEFYESFCK